MKSILQYNILVRHRWHIKQKIKHSYKKTKKLIPQFGDNLRVSETGLKPHSVRDCSKKMILFLNMLLLPVISNTRKYLLVSLASDDLVLTSFLFLSLGETWCRHLLKSKSR